MTSKLQRLQMRTKTIKRRSDWPSSSSSCADGRHRNKCSGPGCRESLAGNATEDRPCCDSWRRPGRRDEEVVPCLTTTAAAEDAGVITRDRSRQGQCVGEEGNRSTSRRAQIVSHLYR